MWGEVLKDNEPKGTAKVTCLRDQTDKVIPGRAEWVGWDEAGKGGHRSYMRVYLALHKPKVGTSRFIRTVWGVRVYFTRELFTKAVIVGSL